MKLFLQSHLITLILYSHATNAVKIPSLKPIELPETAPVAIESYDDVKRSKIYILLLPSE